MPPSSDATLKCTQCDTTFSASDSAQVAAHAGHPVEHIQQG
jgi:hypothetical protein